MEATSTPTVGQMANRANSGHRRILACIATGENIVGPGTSAGAVKGYTTCMATLVRWGCITSERIGTGQYRTTITDHGRALLDHFTTTTGA